MGKTGNLPCSIAEVVDLLGIAVVRRTKTQWQCRCPFCDDRSAHMNVLLSDNVFRCNRCGKGGGVLHLYAEYCNVDRSSAYQELTRIFQGGEVPERKERSQPPETGELTVASVEVRDNTYSNLLSMLSLCPSHQESLKARGLSSEEIAWLGYRTTPAMRVNKIIAGLLERGCILEGVPGFYCDRESDCWNLDIRGSGIMLPDRNERGQIEAIQVRLDKPYHGKFYNLTSTDQYYGTKSHCCAHFIGVNGNDSDESVCLTEGIMKADIAYCLSRSSGYPHGFVGLTGVSNKSQLAAAFTALSSLGKRRILVMYDADYRTNDAVRQLREYAICSGREYGFEMVPVSWDPCCKGIDDLLLERMKRCSSV